MSLVDLIVPTIRGREESLERCVESYKAHTDDLNVIVVDDSKTCGWGWKQGLIASCAPYVLLACDDQECIQGGWVDICVETVNEGLLPCPRVWLPDGRIESNGGDLNAFAHIVMRPQKDRTPVDYTTIPFMGREQAERIGMLDVHYASDVWVSYRGRQLGYETVLRHGFEVMHYHEQVGRGAGMSQGERDTMDCETVLAELRKTEEVATG